MSSLEGNEQPLNGAWLLIQAVSELHSRRVAWRDAHLADVMCNTHSDGNVDLTLIDFGPSRFMPSGMYDHSCCM